MLKKYQEINCVMSVDGLKRNVCRLICPTKFIAEIYICNPSNMFLHSLQLLGQYKVNHFSVGE